jgi:hypothetical protein
MAKKIGTLGGNFLEGSSTSDRIYGDSAGLISSRTMGRDQIQRRGLSLRRRLDLERIRPGRSG